VPIRPEDLAALIRHDREKKGLSQKDYADKVGIGVNTLKDLEQKKHTNPKLSTLGLLAKELDMPTMELHFFDHPAQEEDTAKKKDIQTITNLLQQENPNVIKKIKEIYPHAIPLIQILIKSSTPSDQ
jgi:transcriptional regulator with XRE-family HTH domain